MLPLQRPNHSTALKSRMRAIVLLRRRLCLCWPLGACGVHLRSSQSQISHVGVCAHRSATPALHRMCAAHTRFVAYRSILQLHWPQSCSCVRGRVWDTSTEVRGGASTSSELLVIICRAVPVDVVMYATPTVMVMQCQLLQMNVQDITINAAILRRFFTILTVARTTLLGLIVTADDSLCTVRLAS